MSKSILMGAALLALAYSLPAAAVSDQSIPDDTLGLSKTSVFDVPEPAVVDYKGGDPGANKRIARSYDSAPPMIPHTTKDMVPIKQDFNLCKDCHVQPDLLKEKITKGMPIPAPASHYTDVKKGEMYMGRWNCVQCHRPQAKVNVLVQSTFKKSK